MTFLEYDCPELTHTGWKEAESVSRDKAGGSCGAAVTKEVRVQEGSIHLHSSQNRDRGMKKEVDSAEVTS